MLVFERPQPSIEPGSDFERGETVSIRPIDIGNIMCDCGSRYREHKLGGYVCIDSLRQLLVTLPDQDQMPGANVQVLTPMLRAAS